MKKSQLETFFSLSFEKKYDDLIKEKSENCKERAFENWGLETVNISMDALRVFLSPFCRELGDAGLKIKLAKNNKLMSSNHQATVILLASYELFFYRLTYSLISPIKSEISAIFSYSDITTLILSESVARYYPLENPQESVYSPERKCSLCIKDGSNFDFFINNSRQSFDMIQQIRKKIFAQKSV
ncbi:MAG TPA: hypothetical protein GX745_05775 [Clostridiales bacterium]|jgi:hypothetical protein|nr:hypothetical protein [Clostridiales bacterium]